MYKNNSKNIREIISLWWMNYHFLWNGIFHFFSIFNFPLFMDFLLDIYKCLEEIRKFLNSSLKLELNSKTAYFKEKQGINFLGYRIWKTHLLIRNQSKKKIKRKLKNFQKLYKENRIELEYITACINSWKGYAKFGNSYNLINKILKNFVLRK